MLPLSLTHSQNDSYAGLNCCTELFDFRAIFRLFGEAVEVNIQ